jgi:ATP/maltotriose-dependent transcriptional regulator MalT
VLIRHAPPNLCLFLSGRNAPGIRFHRLRASAELANADAADLAGTSDEADAHLAMVGRTLPGLTAANGPRGTGLTGELRHAAICGKG